MQYWLMFFLWIWMADSHAQATVDWIQLSEVGFVQEMDINKGYIVQRPFFDKSITALEDKQIEIIGYILPLDVSGEVFALSRYPYDACFFCGGGGVESVMNIWFSKPGKRYKLDQVVTLRGILRLIRGGDGLIYLLDKAEEVSK
ncbi:MAG: hypothetical protein AAF655_24625 [Bacteroidota bacterium]